MDVPMLLPSDPVTPSASNFSRNSGFGPMVEEKPGVKGKYSDTAVGGGISRHYAFMNEIITKNIQGMIHWRLFKFT